MMQKTLDVACPWCGEFFTVFFDFQPEEHADYIEDCHVCCRPTRIQIWIDGSGAVSLGAERECQPLEMTWELFEPKCLQFSCFSLETDQLKILIPICPRIVFFPTRYIYHLINHYNNCC